MKKIKIFPLILIVLVIVNMVLFALGKIDQLYFWMTIAVVALYAYKDKFIKKKS